MKINIMTNDESLRVIGYWIEISGLTLHAYGIKIFLPNEQGLRDISRQRFNLLGYRVIGNELHLPLGKFIDVFERVEEGKLTFPQLKMIEGLLKTNHEDNRGHKGEVKENDGKGGISKKVRKPS